MSKIEHPAVTDLNSGLVVDKIKLNSLTALELSLLLSSLYSTGKPVIIMDNVQTFFTGKTLFQKVEAGDSEWELIAEFFNITLSTEDRDTFAKSVEIRKTLMTAISALTPPYPFAEIPKEWDISWLNVNKETVRRKKNNPSGDSTTYTIGKKSLEKVWKAASKRWAGVQGAPTQCGSVQADGYHRNATSFNDRVEIGCQIVRRYELEQLAVHLGWEFPTAA